MPEIPQNNDMGMFNTNNFTYSALDIEKVNDGSCLALIASDASGSICGMLNEISTMCASIKNTCKLFPQADNVLLRFTNFGGHTIEEIHGFQQPKTITDDTIYDYSTRGLTPLYDAIGDMFESVESFSTALDDKDLTQNAILFCITDGCNTYSDKYTSTAQLKSKYTELIESEKLESIQMILIGVNDVQYKQELLELTNEVGFEYISIGDATADEIRKLTDCISNNISASSQAVGTGGASTPILTI